MSWIKPPIKPVRTVDVAKPETVHLDNGVPVFLIDSGTEDIERIEFSYDAGSIHEKIHLTASTTNLMLTEGSEKYTSGMINRLIDTWSAAFNLSPERDRAGLVVFFLNRYSVKVLDIISEILLHPVFPEKELAVLMKKRYNRFLVNMERVSFLASEAFFEMIFGGKHPYGIMTSEKDYTIKDSSELRNFHSAFYRPENLAIFVSGKITNNIVPLLNRHFGQGKNQIERNYPLPGLPEGIRIRSRRIEKKDALQSALRIGSASINKKHSDYHGLKVLNVILGGYFGSRLMKNIREEKGYTYGIGSSLVSLRQSGYFSISAEVSNLFTQNAIDEIYREIKRLQTETVRKAELTVVRNYMMGELMRTFDGPFATAESFRAAWEFGFDTEYYKKYAETIMSIRADELQALANKYLDINNMCEVVAG